MLLQQFKFSFPSDNAYIFRPTINRVTKDITKPISVTAIFNIITKLANQVVSHKNITPHSLRKTFIELALDNGDDLISITNATGHSTVEMIKYYDTRSRIKNNSVNSLSKLI